MNLSYLQPSYLQFYTSFLIFLFATLLVFFLPGYYFISRLKLSTFGILIHSFILGFVLFAIQGFLFGLAQARYLTYVYLSLFIILTLIRLPTLISFIKSAIRLSIDKVFVAISILGIVVQLFSIAPMGLSTKEGDIFCCNLPDSLYHVSLTYELTKNVPPFEPGMTGVVVKNYYYLTNLINADLVRLFHLPLVQTQIEYSQLFFTVLYILIILQLSRTLKLRREVQLLVLLFALFHSDLVYLFVFVLGRGLNLDIRTLHDVTKLWFSPPRVLSAIVFFSFIDLMLICKVNSSRLLMIVLSILAGSLIGFKIYTSIFALFGLGVLCIYYLFRKDFRLLIVFFGAMIISALLYLPINSGTQASFAFRGLGLFENFFAEPTAINFVIVEVARLYFLKANNLLLVGIIELFYFIGFITLTFGTLLFGLFNLKKTFSLLPKDFNIMITAGSLLSLALGFFFTQNPGNANTLQFLITVELFLIFFAAVAVAQLKSRLNSRIAVIFLIVVILLTGLKTVLLSYRNMENIVRGQTYLISKHQLQAVNFLRTKTPRDSIVLIDRHLTWENLEYQMRFLSERNFFLLGKNILGDHGVDYSSRYELIKSLEKNTGIDQRYIELKKNSITHIWYRKDVPAISSVFLKKYGKKVYENKKIAIFELL